MSMVLSIAFRVFASDERYASKTLPGCAEATLYLNETRVERWFTAIPLRYIYIYSYQY